MTDNIQDVLEKAHDSKVLTKPRIYFLTGSIDIDKYNEAAINLVALDQNPAEITIYINSEGGEVIHANAIFDLIKTLKSKTKGIVFGEVCSSAAYLLQACTERTMSLRSQMMIHIGEEGHSSNHPKNIEVWAKRNKEMGDEMANVFLSRIKEKNIKYTKKRVDKLLEFDTILKPKEALSLGLIDKILK